MSLHTLNKSPFSSHVAGECLAILQGTDTLILLEDGVYCGLELSAISSVLQQKIIDGLSVYYISADAQARGIQDKISNELTPINYTKFVELATEHKPITSWF